MFVATQNRYFKPKLDLFLGLIEPFSFVFVFFAENFPEHKNSIITR